MVVDNCCVSTHGICPILLNERNARQSHFQECSEIVLWKIAFKAPALFIVCVHHDYGWRPDRVEAVKVFGVFLDVHPERDEVFVNE